MAFPAAEPSQPQAALRRLGAALLSALQKGALALEGYPLERIGLAALAAGVVLRLAAPFFMDFRSDGDTYVAMGHAWMLHHEFLMPYGDVTTWLPLPPGYSNHYPPMYPFYLGLFFSIFGFGLVQAKAAAVVVSLASLAVAYFSTRDLYGRVPAAILAGLLALEPHFVWATGTGFSENMVLLFFGLTMWAIMRSLADDRFILLAGLFAGLAYLTRASVGYFFVIAGLGGFLWRFYYRRWKLFTNVWYMGAIAIFVAIAGWWALRNSLLFPPVTQTFGGYVITLPAWETSSYIRWVQEVAIVRCPAPDHDLVCRTFGQDHDGPRLWWQTLKGAAPWFVLFLAWWVVPLVPEGWRATKKIREESTSALWLSVFLVWLTAWVLSSMFTVTECHSCAVAGKAFFIQNMHRYVVIGLLPLGWLLLREARLDRASTRVRIVLLALSLFCATGAEYLEPVRYADLRAAQFMDPYLHAGDVIGIGYGDTIKYAFYAYLTHPEQVFVYGCGDVYRDPAHGDYSLVPYSDSCQASSPNATYRAAFVLTLRQDAYEGYQKVGTFRQRYSDGGTVTATLYARDDVVAARHIPTDLVKDYD